MVDDDEPDTDTSQDDDDSAGGALCQLFPEEITAFEPPPEAIKRPLATEGRSLRLIFGAIPLDDFETASLSQLKSELNRRNFPSGNLFDDDRQKLRFLQGNKWVVDDCAEDMFRHLEWRKKFLPILRCDVKQSMKKGFCYIHGRDKCLRPILVVRCKEMIDTPPEEGVKLVVFWLEYAIANLLLESKVEQWRAIIDLVGCSTYNLPVKALKEVALTLTKNYRGRLNKMIFVNSTLVLWSIWQLVNVVLPETTRKKIRILTSDYSVRWALQAL